MTKDEMIKELRKEANNDGLVMDVLTALADRERPRSTLTLVGIQHMMRKWGTNSSKSAYIPVVRILAKLGVGELEIGSRSNIKGLKGIKLHLGKLGKAVTKGVPYDLASKYIFKEVEKKRKDNNFPGLVTKPEILKNPVRLQLFVNDKVFEIPVPKSLDIVQIAHIIGEVFSEKKGA